MLDNIRRMVKELGDAETTYTVDQASMDEILVAHSAWATSVDYPDFSKFHYWLDAVIMETDRV
jgi:hypothetical protein